MALHFLVTDYGLRKDHRRDYDRIGRWALSVALAGGLAAGYLVRLPELRVAVITAFPPAASSSMCSRKNSLRSARAV